MTDLPLLSASQISLWTECKRKWGFKYLDRIQTPPNAAAALGTEVHDEQLDPYLMKGRGFDFSRSSGEIANALTPLLPRPMTPGMRTKRTFLLPSPSGKFMYRGEIDLYAKDSACVPGLAAEGGGGVPLLGDFKTTGNLDYAKTLETLAIDIQHTIYAVTILFEDVVNEFDSVWFYVRTRGKHRVQRTFLKVREVVVDPKTTVTTAHVIEQFQKVDAIGIEVAAIKLAKPKASELPPNARMCDAYGGCPFRHVCNLSPAVHAAAINMEAVVEAKTNDFLAGLRKQTAPTVNAPPAPSTFVVYAAGPEATLQPGVHMYPTPAPVPPPASPAANQFAVPPATQLPSWATSPGDPLKQQMQAIQAAHAPAPVAINPPEATLPPAPPVGSAEAPKRRGRPPGQVAAPSVAGPGDGARIEALEGIANLLRSLKVKRIALDANGALLEVEVM